MLLYLVHTMDELHFTGNCLKGSRPILSFDASFEKQAHTRVIKETLLHVFGVPQGAQKSKPFVDHVMSFIIAEGKIWVRCYQISENEVSYKNKENELNGEAEVESKQKRSGRDLETDLTLVEIGPRFVLTPIIIQESSFGGPIIYENKEFVSPNQVRADLRLAKAARTTKRSEQSRERSIKRNELTLTTQSRRRKIQDPLDEKVLFA
jgi:ribosome biogenesis protein BRX1